MPNRKDSAKKMKQMKIVNQIWEAFMANHPELNAVFANDNFAQLMNSQAKSYAGTAVAFTVDFMLEEIERVGVEAFAKQTT